ncbi:hypothetical protein DFH09DRAFT_176190 [Mycena vulgaris]|nr:hypothetical protein DFH09DRAFT_176190 [Mycena vulgaris]
MYDTMLGQDSPHGRFTDPLWGAYVVHATSPKISRWKEWSKQLEADLWPMPLWSNAELQQIDNLYPRDTSKYYTALQLAAFLGPSPRKCIVQTEIGSDFRDYRPLDFTDGSTLYKALTSGEAPKLSQGLDFHLFFFAGTIRGCGVRKHTSNPAHYRRYYTPTRFLRQAALAMFRDKSIEEQQNVCRQFSAHPRLCGAFYEVLGLKVLLVDDLLISATWRKRGPTFSASRAPNPRVRRRRDGRSFQLPRRPPLDPATKFPKCGCGCNPKRWHVGQDAPAKHGPLARHKSRRDRSSYHQVLCRRQCPFRIRVYHALGRDRQGGGAHEGALDQRVPYALRLRVKPVGRQPPAEPIRIPIGYAVAGFMKQEDLLAHAVGGSSNSRWTH